MMVELSVLAAVLAPLKHVHTAGLVLPFVVVIGGGGWTTGARR
jgi:hypothetical protein